MREGMPGSSYMGRGLMEISMSENSTLEGRRGVRVLVMNVPI